MQPGHHTVGAQAIFRVVLEAKVPLLNGQLEIIRIVLRVEIRLGRSGHLEEGWGHRLPGRLVHGLTFGLGIKAV